MRKAGAQPCRKKPDHAIPPVASLGRFRKSSCYLAGSDSRYAATDSMFCGVMGTSVQIEVPHTTTSAESVSTIARAIMPTVTMLNPNGHDHP